MSEQIRIHHLFNLKYHRHYGNEFGQHFHHYDQLREKDLNKYHDIAGDKFIHDMARTQYDNFDTLLQIPDEADIILSKELDDICNSCVVGKHCLEREVIEFDETIGSEFVSAAKKLGLINELSINGMLNDSDFTIKLKMKIIWKVLDSLTKWQEYFEKQV